MSITAPAMKTNPGAICGNDRGIVMVSVAEYRVGNSRGDTTAAKTSRDPYAARTVGLAVAPRERESSARATGNKTPENISDPATIYACQLSVKNANAPKAEAVIVRPSKMMDLPLTPHSLRAGRTYNKPIAPEAKLKL
mmetsp:Transcript_17232/g.24128  ORF Transcript_17232/g.24128 Transcript_17232/m.24128 type:complete len:138 (-) Transcript_17232:39-452(-)|eukprot:CAMPEP_0184503842 /NCGR_PEP_ID=MMETSP0113_2-20130426/52127_1 /TAXON_ID=91329 /ORGANISM="Norrisiella sphaerica, Strain BC52" /LENGTH=137 /DNA_ID=CAMNT_0026893405 /DNA_START=217 /DNA_END=630 /DNA_ORIENTATION=+